MHTKTCLLPVLLFFTTNIFSQSAVSTNESKVDYLERIYFSGENKDGLKVQILIAIQELQKKSKTPAIEKQSTFLADFRDKASTAKDACDILELLAVGIYNIDAAEAVQQGVRPPSDKAKAKLSDALVSLNKINSTSRDLNLNARDLQVSTVATSKTVSTGAGKVANTSVVVGKTASTVEQLAQTAKHLAVLSKTLTGVLGKKDKPCNAVPKKDIQIGEHPGLIESPTQLQVRN